MNEGVIGDKGYKHCKKGNEILFGHTLTKERRESFRIPSNYLREILDETIIDITGSKRCLIHESINNLLI